MIKRHTFNKEIFIYVSNDTNERIKRLINYIRNEQKSYHVDLICDVFIELIGYLVVENQKPQVLINNMQAYLDVLYGLYQIETTPTGGFFDFESSFMETVTVEQNMGRSCINVSKVYRAYLFIFMTRDYSQLKKIRLISNDFLRTKTEDYGSMFDYRYALDLVCEFPEDAIGAVLDVREMVENEDYPIFAKQNKLKILPALTVLSKILENDQEGFDTTLLEAVKLHKKYYKGKHEQLHSIGFYSESLTAYCCLAYDRGMKINVESDYLLKDIIEKNF